MIKQINFQLQGYFMKKNHLSVLFTLIVIFLIACQKENMEGYKLYENEEYQFTIQYPEDWTYREGFAEALNPEHGSIVVFQSPNEGKFDLFRENVHIFAEALPDSVADIASYLKYSKNFLPTQFDEITFLDEGRLAIDGKISRWIMFEYVRQLRRVSSIGYMFYMDGYGLVINSTARPEDIMKYRRTFENISTSIKFK
ncbi:MAG: hypothetical protein C4543_02135 [Ignavibacteriales bacterium]|nr:MAG: hypothetical protein C4543_02135 [Ignavibacteriales bacterium]